MFSYISKLNLKENKLDMIYPIYEEVEICKEICSVLECNLNELVSKEYNAVTTIYTLGKYEFKKIIFVGLGKEKDCTTSKIRKAIKGMIGDIKDESVVLLNPIAHETISFSTLTHCIVESIMEGTYQFTKLTTDKKANLEFHLICKEDITKDIEDAEVVGSAISFARDLGNMPSNYMTPTILADKAIQMAKKCGLEYQVFGKAELRQMGAGALLGVNQGSEEEPKLIVLKYNGNKEEPYTALIGKGLTFDSGGYNLKPSASMTGMKMDMCGGANVIGAMQIIANRKPKANVYGIIPATENMISGKGYKCDDVLVSMSKKTIEITNTDAEGRLILCDAITYAQSLNVNHIIDIATLTGACFMALGSEYTGVFSNNDDFYHTFMEVTKQQDEKGWRLPLDEEYRASLKKTKVADIMNSVKGGAGASVAAEFLHEFVEDTVAWIHLDVAGTADTPNGATGVMVKSMAGLFF